MALKCDICGQDWLYRVRIENGKQICRNCDKSPSSKEYFYPQEKVLIGGKFELKSRVDEVRRRVILPYERTDGKSDYYVGRRRDDGGIDERVPDY